MGIKIKNLQTGEFEKFNIPALKGEKGEPGEIEPSEKVDYIGKQHSKLRDTMNANVDYAVKTAIGEFNYLNYEGQHITATNSIEGHAKSAILSGSTKYQIGEFIQDVYVPVQKFKTGYYLGHEDGTLIQGRNEHKYCEDYVPLPTGVTSITSKGSNCWKKLCCYDSNKNFISGVNGTDWLEDLTLNIPSNAKYFRYSTNTSKGENEYINVVSNTGLLLASSNYNIPCELTSCKMPVLKTTGKNQTYPILGGDINSNEYNLMNLTDENYNTNAGLNKAKAIKWVDNETFHIKGYGIDQYDNQYKIFLKPSLLKPNQKYRVSFKEIGGAHEKNDDLLTLGNLYMHINGTAVFTMNKNNTVATFTTPNDITGFSVNLWLSGKITKSDVIYAIFKEFMIEELENEQQPVSYEPYKSNILSTPSDLELKSAFMRDNSTIRDEINLLTGELKESTLSITLNGSENWALGGYSANIDGYPHFTLNASIDFKQNSGVICKFPFKDYDLGGWKTYEGCAITTGSGYKKIMIRVNSDIATSVDEFKEWLKKNPFEMVLVKNTSTIKTVDLSDNHVYSYKDVTHYDCSSAEGYLVPTLSVKVPTDVQLTIQEQKATTQTLLIKNMDLQQSIKEVQVMNLAFNTALYNSFNSIREEVEDIKKHVSTNENLEGSF